MDEKKTKIIEENQTGCDVHKQDILYFPYIGQVDC